MLCYVVLYCTIIYDTIHYITYRTPIGLPEHAPFIHQQKHLPVLPVAFSPRSQRSLP